MGKKLEVYCESCDYKIPGEEVYTDWYYCQECDKDYQLYLKPGIGMYNQVYKIPSVINEQTVIDK